METGYKVMAYKKTANSAQIETVRVDDRQVDATGELALWQEEDGRTGRSHRMTGVFHPRSQPRPFRHTEVFHPQIVDGVAYIPPAQPVSSSQVLEVKDWIPQENAMRLIDDVINTVAKTEPHEVSFVDNPFIDPTKPNLQRVEPALVSRAAEVEETEAKPARPRWLSSPGTDKDILSCTEQNAAQDALHPGSTLVLRSTQKAVIIPEPSVPSRSTDQIKAWVAGDTTALSLPAVQSEPAKLRSLSVISANDLRANKETVSSRAVASPILPTISPSQPVILASSSNTMASASLGEQPPAVNSATTLQKYSLWLLSILVVVEILRLVLGK